MWFLIILEYFYKPVFSQAKLWENFQIINLKVKGPAKVWDYNTSIWWGIEYFYKYSLCEWSAWKWSISTQINFTLVYLSLVYGIRYISAYRCVGNFYSSTGFY